uniref:Putative secreted protein n=1 Tax=Ixodes ricinus TaxID=34613 RepID=A0A6B0UM64_IXORI
MYTLSPRGVALCALSSAVRAVRSIMQSAEIGGWFTDPAKTNSRFRSPSFFSRLPLFRLLPLVAVAVLWQMRALPSFLRSSLRRFAISRLLFQALDSLHKRWHHRSLAVLHRRYLTLP